MALTSKGRAVAANEVIPWNPNAAATASLGRMAVPKLSLPPLAPSFGMCVPPPRRGIIAAPQSARPQYEESPFRKGGQGVTYRQASSVRTSRSGANSTPRGAQTDRGKNEPSAVHRVPQPPKGDAPGKRRARFKPSRGADDEHKYHVRGGDYRIDKDGRRFNAPESFAMRQEGFDSKKHHYGAGDYRGVASGKSAMKQRIDAKLLVEWKMGDDGLWHGTQPKQIQANALPSYKLATDAPVHHIKQGDFRNHAATETYVNAQSEDVLAKQGGHRLQGDYRHSLEPEKDPAPAPPSHPAPPAHVLKGDYREARHRPAAAAWYPSDDWWEQVLSPSKAPLPSASKAPQAAEK